ncbi:MAG: hypothetical protein JWN70_5687, partial [Planctomycetaceae bacterium]|nr:hypothetical protein [Planctomycetaceae bacterium]
DAPPIGLDDTLKGLDEPVACWGAGAPPAAALSAGADAPTGPAPSAPPARPPDTGG